MFSSLHNLFPVLFGWLDDKTFCKTQMDTSHLSREAFLITLPQLMPLLGLCSIVLLNNLHNTSELQTLCLCHSFARLKVSKEHSLGFSNLVFYSPTLFYLYPSASILIVNGNSVPGLKGNRQTYK